HLIGGRIVSNYVRGGIHSAVFDLFRNLIGAGVEKFSSSNHAPRHVVHFKDEVAVLVVVRGRMPLLARRIYRLIRRSYDGFAEGVDVAQEAISLPAGLPLLAECGLSGQ